MPEQSSYAHGPAVEAHGAGHDPHGAGHHGHSSGIAKYIVVFVLLCLLTTVSFVTYSDWWRAMFTPETSRLLMMAVSCMKALLVILFFMHVLYEANWKYVLTIPAALMSLFLILMLVPDIGMRLRWASEERRHHMAEERARHPATPTHADAEKSQPHDAK